MRCASGDGVRCADGEGVRCADGEGVRCASGEGVEVWRSVVSALCTATNNPQNGQSMYIIPPHPPS